MTIHIAYERIRFKITDRPTEVALFFGTYRFRQFRMGINRNVTIAHWSVGMAANRLPQWMAASGDR